MYVHCSLLADEMNEIGVDDLTSMTLLLLCSQKLKIPYLGSGGFSDGRGPAAAIRLGACGYVGYGTEAPAEPL